MMENFDMILTLMHNMDMRDGMVIGRVQSRLTCIMDFAVEAANLHFYTKRIQKSKSIFRCDEKWLATACAPCSSLKTQTIIMYEYEYTGESSPKHWPQFSYFSKLQNFVGLMSARNIYLIQWLPLDVIQKLVLLATYGIWGKYWFRVLKNENFLLLIFTF
jgi:hypothetical protein